MPMAYSYSALRLYLTCPRKYEYAFVKKITRPLTPGESFGSSMHNTLKKWGELEMEATAAKQPSLQEQTMMFAADNTSLAPDALSEQTLTALWHQNFIVDTYATRVEADFARKRGEAMIRHDYDWWRGGCPPELRGNEVTEERRWKPRQVVTVEKGFTLH